MLAATNAGLKRNPWMHGGVTFEREWHSYTGPKHGVTIEIVTLTRLPSRGWSLMVTKEYWWTGPESRPFKSVRWARSLSNRTDLFALLNQQEAALETSSRGGAETQV